MTPAIDPFDELAALFLTDPDIPTRGGGGGGTAPAQREVLLVGHLPVRASVWLAPYADAAARDTGPVALLRLDDSAAHLQLMRAGDELDRIEHGTPLRRTIELLRPSISLWIVRPPADMPADALLAAAPERLTLLSGADEAALVAAYQTIKQIAAASQEGARELPQLGMALLGCDHATADGALRRLNQTTRSFLGVELSLVLCLPRMDAGLLASGYRHFLDEARPELGEVMRWIGEPAAGAAPRSAPRSAPAAAPRTSAPALTAPRAAAPPPSAGERHARTAEPAESHREHEAPRPASRPASPPPPPEHEWVARRTMALRPHAGVEVEPKQPRGQREPDDHGRPVPLASYVPGLVALPVRCPRHERVELAVGDGGRLHLLGRDETLRDMQVVRRWAMDHRELLSMACAEQPVDGRLEPRLHLFTAEPTRLADLHGSDLHLHVLAPVQLEGRTGWYAAALNEVGAASRK